MGSASHCEDIDKDVGGEDDFYGKSRTPRMGENKVTPSGHNQHLLVSNCKILLSPADASRVDERGTIDIEVIPEEQNEIKLKNQSSIQAPLPTLQRKSNE